MLGTLPIEHIFKGTINTAPLAFLIICLNKCLWTFHIYVNYSRRSLGHLQPNLTESIIEWRVFNLFKWRTIIIHTETGLNSRLVKCVISPLLQMYCKSFNQVVTLLGNRCGCLLVATVLLRCVMWPVAIFHLSLFLTLSRETRAHAQFHRASVREKWDW